ncbi:hypothetical protein ABID52_000414 [Fictibacillus halophilus]|uniref:Uncharacterized protein n=1 Tax=Fictibacillus halophilus TaxID=1610490 RepID=A0ABV2LE23_9BACL|nr:hypothetical protein [Fictibacillus halophilus]
MGFLKGLGKVAGQVAGGVVGGTVKIIGEATNNKFIQEIGDGVYHASVQAGELAGQAASGLVDVASGIIQQDNSKIDDGFSDIGKAVGTTAKGVGRTIVTVAENGGTLVKGILENDTTLLKDGAKGLVKTAAVVTLAVGVVDMVDGSDAVAASELPETPTNDSDVQHVDPHWRTLEDGRQIWVDGDGDTTNNLSADEGGGYFRSGSETTLPNHDESVASTSNVHHVEPHWRILENGEQIWVDGDGDTSTNLTEEQGGGYFRSNPDGILSNNLDK